MANVVIPNLPDVSGKYTEDEQLRNFLIAVKQTLEILTGSTTNSNAALIDLINSKQ